MSVHSKIWKSVHISDVADINPRPETDELDGETLVSFIPMRCVEEVSGRFQSLEDRKIKDVRKGYTAFRNGDVLFAKVTPCMENGKAAVVKGLTNGIGYGSTEFFALRPKNHLMPEFLFFFISQESFRRLAAANMTGAVGLRRVPKKYLAEQVIPCPPLSEQRQAVDEVEKQFTRLDAGVAALGRVQTNLIRYRSAVLNAACEGRLVPTEAELAKTGKRRSNFETGEALLAHILAERRKHWRGRGQYCEPLGPDTSILPAVPNGWTWATAEQLCWFITKGTTPSAEKMQHGGGEVQFVKVYNLTFNGVLNLNHKPIFISRKTHELDLARSEIKAGDILINIVGPPLGQVSIVPTSVGEANINQAIARFRVVLPECRKLFAICLMAVPIIGWAIEKAKTTAGQSNLTLELCRHLPIPLPPLSEQARIVAEVERRLSVVEELETTLTANLQRAARLRQAILQRAFSEES